MLEIKDLNICYRNKPAVSNISLQVQQKQIVGIVGESGSGKSTVIESILGLLSGDAKVTGGQILFDGKDLLKESEEGIRRIRGAQIGMIFQHPQRYLDPIKTIGSQFCESIRAHNKVSKQEAMSCARDTFQSLCFDDPDPILKAYPFELSGGMCQRASIAIAMANKPKLLLADEPTSALDVTIQTQVAQTMIHLKECFDTSILIVTHNMGLIAYMADVVGVMYKGGLVEWGSKDQVLFSPKHEHTKRLIQAIPKMDGSMPE